MPLSPDLVGDLSAAQTCPSGRMKMEELFRQWLSLDTTKEMIITLVDDVKHGRDIVVPSPRVHNVNASPLLQP